MLLTSLFFWKQWRPINRERTTISFYCVWFTHPCNESMNLSLRNWRTRPKSSLSIPSPLNTTLPRHNRFCRHTLLLKNSIHCQYSTLNKQWINLVWESTDILLISGGSFVSVARSRRPTPTVKNTRRHAKMWYIYINVPYMLLYLYLILKRTSNIFSQHKRSKFRPFSKKRSEF